MNSLAVSDSESSDDAGDEADIYEIDPSSFEAAREARDARAARRAGIKTSGTANRFHYFDENPITSKLVHRPRFLVCGQRGMGQSTHVSPALLHSMEHIPVHCLDLPALFGCASKTAEEACAQVRLPDLRAGLCFGDNFPTVCLQVPDCVTRIEGYVPRTTETL